jgi:farnesyl diphosphate synthase
LTRTEFDTWVLRQREQVEQALNILLPDTAPPRLADAMRHSVFSGGNSLRALLVMATRDAVAGSTAAALRAAVAVELVYAGSRSHQDLPCMDMGSVETGRPSICARYGETLSLLAGNANVALAFDALTADHAVPAVMQARLCSLLAGAAGHNGLAGGQAIEATQSTALLSNAELRDLHTRKTGALFQASVLMGATCGDAPKGAVSALRDYANAICLACCVVNDIRNASQNRGTCPPGFDATVSDTPSFVAILGEQAARSYAATLRDSAQQALVRSGLPSTELLDRIADMLIDPDMRETVPLHPAASCPDQRELGDQQRCGGALTNTKGPPRPAVAANATMARWQPPATCHKRSHEHDRTSRS